MLRTTLLILAAPIFLVACGGGGDASVTAPPSAPPPSAEPPGTSSCPNLGDGVDLLPGAPAPLACARPPGVTLRYATGSDAHQLDLYRPATGVGPWPLVVWIHGGGWRTGSRNSLGQVGHLLCRGYAVASIDYRLSDEASFPAQIQDAKAAVRYLRAQSAALSLDPNRVATFGSSAGAHLATLVATSQNVASLDDPALGHASLSSRPQTAVSWYGPTDFSAIDSQLIAQGCNPSTATHSEANSAESVLLGCRVGDPACAARVALANPATHVDGSTPPLLILHGTQDCTVPTAQSALLKAAMDRAKRCSIHRRVLDAGHGGDAWVSTPVQDLLVRYLDQTLKAP